MATFIALIAYYVIPLTVSLLFMSSVCFSIILSTITTVLSVMVKFIATSLRFINANIPSHIDFICVARCIPHAAMHYLNNIKSFV
ncbi:hypothetical protein BpHYR1_014751 [Brachionus plicatilis]|uniref:Uncharacterized protein n=1 Tax=Brachionus plicatilis TaxID=10195 RepID=A0A3M7S3N4_BRAPC|nr:hypothetical protein BpHYR1_014751 [Brachionus plicatilis]